MKIIIKITLFVVLFSFSASAQQLTFRDSLLEHFTGKWVLQGIIDSKTTIHDVTVEWVLNHQYIQIKEVSREKKVDGEAEYEAIVFIGWDQLLKEYTCLWLDVTGSGGLTAQAIGHSKQNGNEIAFLFKLSESSIFHTKFVYNADNDTWQWLMDDEENGQLQPFARVTLKRE
jgi:hypothetical protein